MRINNGYQFPLDPLKGAAPELLWDTSAVDGDYGMFEQAAVGTTFWRQAATGHVQLMVKVNNGDRDDDWVCVGGVISQRVAYTDFTDGGAAAGTLALTNAIPIGAFVDFINVRNVTGFTGDTSAALIVGDGTDTDRYNTGTPSVFTTASVVAMGVPSGTRHHTAAATVTLTVTSATDFTSVSAGALTIDIHYRI